MKSKTPWKDYMGDVPMHLDYFQGSMFEAVERMADMYPNNIAFDFMGQLHHLPQDGAGDREVRQEPEDAWASGWATR